MVMVCDVVTVDGDGCDVVTDDGCDVVAVDGNGL